MDNNFTKAFNKGNAAFAKDCGEQFKVEVTTGKQKGRPGTYRANSIDDMNSAVSGAPGGAVAQNQTHIYVSKVVMAQAEIIDGSVLSARGRKVRVKEITDLGDDKVTLICDKVGLVAQTT